MKYRASLSSHQASHKAFCQASTTYHNQRKFMANILIVAGSNSKYQEAGAKAAGFWAGLWHGIILPITFIV